MFTTQGSNLIYRHGFNLAPIQLIIPYLAHIVKKVKLNWFLNQSGFGRKQMALKLFIRVWTELRENIKEWQDIRGLGTARDHHMPVPGRASGQKPLLEDSSQGQLNPTYFRAVILLLQDPSSTSGPLTHDCHWLSPAGRWRAEKSTDGSKGQLPCRAKSRRVDSASKGANTCQYLQIKRFLHKILDFQLLLSYEMFLLPPLGPDVDDELELSSGCLYSMTQERCGSQIFPVKKRAGRREAWNWNDYLPTDAETLIQKVLGLLWISKFIRLHFLLLEEMEVHMNLSQFD